MVTGVVTKTALDRSAESLTKTLPSIIRERSNGRVDALRDPDVDVTIHFHLVPRQFRARDMRRLDAAGRFLT